MIFLIQKWFKTKHARVFACVSMTCKHVNILLTRIGTFRKFKILLQPFEKYLPNIQIFLIPIDFNFTRTIMFVYLYSKIHLFLKQQQKIKIRPKNS